MISVKRYAFIAVLLTICVGATSVVQAQVSGSQGSADNILLEAIDRADNDVEMLGRMGQLDEGSVYLMSVDEVATPPSSSQIDQAVEANRDAVDDLRRALIEQSAVDSILENEDVRSQDILAIRGNEDLEVIVIYHRP